MIRVGIIDPDTSHARAFAKILSAMPNVRLTAVLNLSGKRDSSWINEFAQEFELRVCESRTSFNFEIDAAIILTLDWERHLHIAGDFAKLKKVVLIDKPVCGSLKDVLILQQLIVFNPTRYFGGSAVPYAREVLDVLAQDHAGETSEILIRGPIDPFYVGIHSAELLAQFFLLEPKTLIHATADHITVAEGDFFVHLLPAQTWSIELVQSNGRHKFEIPTDSIYENYLAKFVDFAEGRGTSNILLSLNAVLVELAAVRSRKLKRAIKLSELALGMSIESAEFLRSYQPEG